MIIECGNGYKILADILGGEVITMNSDNYGYINPFEIVDNPDSIDKLNSREDIISRFKEIYTLQLKFDTENTWQKLSFEDIKSLCKSANFTITDNELISIIHECEKNL